MIAPAGSLAAADANFIALLKGQRFEQTGASFAALTDAGQSPEDCPFGFDVFADGSNSNSLIDGTVQIPGGATVALNRESPTDRTIETEYQVDELIDLNAARPNGIYTIRLTTLNDGPQSISLSLTGDAYPSLPMVTNYAALQAITAASDTTVQWTPMTGGTVNDIILFAVMDAETDDTVFESNMPGSPGALNGESTQVTIPAGTLQAGHRYEAEVGFIKVVATDAGYAPAVAGYYKVVTFDMAASALAGTPLGAQFESSSPSEYSNDVPQNSAVAFRFSQPMLTTARSVSWTINGSAVTNSLFTYEWMDSNQVLLCRYQFNWPANAQVGWTLNLTDFRDAASFALTGTMNGSFHTDSATPSSPPDVADIYFAKMRGFRQTGASPVSTGMWGAAPELEPTGYNRVKSATVTVMANGRSGTLARNPWGESLGGECNYASQVDLDRIFANGDFKFDLTTLADGAKSVTLSLGATDDYPAIPTISNLAALQAIDPAAPTTISWEALSGWSPTLGIGSGIIEVEIENSAGNEVYEVENSELTSASQCTIPAGILWPGRTYRVNLTFIRLKDLDVSYAFAAAGFASGTEFEITTTGQPVMPTVLLERTGAALLLTAYGGEPNRQYVVETSCDMQRWLPQQQFWLGDAPNSYVDWDAQYLSRRFYRLRDHVAGEEVTPRVSIQGTIWVDDFHTTPAAGAVIGTSLDTRTTVADSQGRFFLETDTPSQWGISAYTIHATHGHSSISFGPWVWGDQPREQTFDLVE